jgi:uncharacterized RDD family membrane protein YckC
MKCPNCDLITSRKNDYCPRCDSNLIPHKKSLGIYDPNATPPPRQKKSAPAPKANVKTGFLAKILKKKNTPKPIEKIETPTTSEELPRTQIVEAKPVVEALTQAEALESEVHKQIEKTNQVADDFAEFAKVATSAPEYHEIPNSDFEDEVDDDYDDNDDSEMLFTPDSDDNDEHQLGFTPDELEMDEFNDEFTEQSSGDALETPGQQFTGDASGATQEIQASEDIEMESLFAELDLDAHTEGIEDGETDDVFAGEALDILPSLDTEADSEPVLNEEEALKSLAQSLELALGEAHVATKKLQSNTFENEQEFSLELPIDLLESSVQSSEEEEKVEEEQDEDKALLSGLMASLEELQAGTEEKSIVEKRNDNDDDSLFGEVDKNSSTEDSLNDELSLLLGGDSVEETDSTPQTASGSDPFEDSLAALEKELDSELSELAAEGTTFLGPNEAGNVLPKEEEKPEQNDIDPLASLQAELDSELSALAGEGTSFLGTDLEATSLEESANSITSDTQEISLPTDIDPLAELEEELAKELDALAEIQEGGFFDGGEKDVSEKNVTVDGAQTSPQTAEVDLMAGDPLADLEAELSQELSALAEIQEGGFFSGDETEAISPSTEKTDATYEDPLADLEAELSNELNALEAEQEGGFFSSAEEKAAQELEVNLEKDIESSVAIHDDSDASFPDLSAVEEELEAELAAMMEAEASETDVVEETEEIVASVDASPRLDVMETGVFLTSDLEKILAESGGETTGTDELETLSGVGEEIEQELHNEASDNAPLAAATQTGTFLVEDLARIIDTEAKTDATPEEREEDIVEDSPQRLAATETGVFLASDLQRLIEEQDSSLLDTSNNDESVQDNTDVAEPSEDLATSAADFEEDESSLEDDLDKSEEILLDSKTHDLLLSETKLDDDSDNLSLTANQEGEELESARIVELNDCLEDANSPLEDNDELTEIGEEDITDDQVNLSAEEKVSEETPASSEGEELEIALANVEDEELEIASAGMGYPAEDDVDVEEENIDENFDEELIADSSELSIDTSEASFSYNNEEYLSNENQVVEESLGEETLAGQVELNAEDEELEISTAGMEYPAADDVDVEEENIDEDFDEELIADSSELSMDASEASFSYNNEEYLSNENQVVEESLGEETLAGQVELNAEDEELEISTAGMEYPAADDVDVEEENIDEDFDEELIADSSELSMDASEASFSYNNEEYLSDDSQESLEDAEEDLNEELEEDDELDVDTLGIEIPDMQASAAEEDDFDQPDGDNFTPLLNSYEDTEDDEVTSTLVRPVDTSIFDTPVIDENDTAELAVVELMAALDELPKDSNEKVETQIDENTDEESSPVLLLGKAVEELEAASLTRRALSILVDTIVVLALGLVATSVMGHEANLIEQIFSGDKFNAFEFLPNILDAILCTLAVWVLSSFALLAGLGQTLGGKLADIKVVQHDYSRLTVSQAGVRACAQVLTLTTLGIGFLTVLRKEGRFLHDYISETRVVRTK